MSRYLIKSFTEFYYSVEIFLTTIFKQPPPALAAVAFPNQSYSAQNLHKQKSPAEFIKDLLGDGILWAVPKHRRTIEKRLNRKFGYPQYNWKLLRVKTHLRNCNQCGHDYEAGHLCPFCYDKVRQETKQMQEKIEEELGLDPIEQDVIVLYEGERKNQPAEVLNGKRVVEMAKPRPMWFSKNLLQKTTQQPSKSTEIKPNDLA